VIESSPTEQDLEETMKIAVMIIAGSLLASSACLAETSFDSSRGAEQLCNAAAVSAENQGSATDDQLASCTLAIRLITGGGPSETAYLAELRTDSTLMLPGQIWHRVAAAYINRGVLYLARGEYAKTIADSDNALKMDNNYPEALINRGAAYIQLHRPADAVQDFTHALDMSPARVERVYFDRAMARENMGDIKGAYADYREAAAINPAWEAPRMELTRFKVIPARPVS
jgi:tetratricopeptide (TPR) repeat protein